MKQVFNTSVGTLEVLVDRASRTISIYRFDEQHRAIAAAIENWDHIDLLDVLNRQAGVPLTEANRIAAALREQHSSLGSLADRLELSRSERRGWSSVENAGIPLRFVAVLLDAVLVFVPLGILVALMSGGGYAERGPGYANAGVNVGGNAFWLLLALGIGYYVVCEAAAGATLGKRMVGIRVVGEDGEHVTFAAALVRNLVRVVDALFFYLVGFLFALTSTRGQRLGDRAAHTIVVRR
ncbi:MAG TPA: RDD family protein [Gaiellaceae bacterium]